MVLKDRMTFYLLYTGCFLPEFDGHFALYPFHRLDEIKQVISLPENSHANGNFQRYREIFSSFIFYNYTMIISV